MFSLLYSFAFRLIEGKIILMFSSFWFYISDIISLSSKTLRIYDLAFSKSKCIFCFFCLFFQQNRQHFCFFDLLPRIVSQSSSIRWPILFLVFVLKLNYTSQTVLILWEAISAKALNDTVRGVPIGTDLVLLSGLVIFLFPCEIILLELTV